MSLLNRRRFSRLNLGAASFLLLAMFSTASFAGVIYEYREDGSPTVIGTLEVASPPASASIGWSTAAPSDLIALFWMMPFSVLALLICYSSAQRWGRRDSIP